MARYLEAAPKTLHWLQGDSNLGETAVSRTQRFIDPVCGSVPDLTNAHTAHCLGKYDLPHYNLLRWCNVPTATQPTTTINTQQNYPAIQNNTSQTIMADYTSYGTPSADWVALAPTLPAIPTDLSLPDLIKLTNSGREATSASEMTSQGLSDAVSLRDITIPARNNSGTIEARSYRPKSVSSATTPLPTYINLHGGGFVFGTLQGEDAACSRIVHTLATGAQPFPVTVVNVNYRHTPEHTFPTAWEDVEDALVYLNAHREELGLDTAQWLIGGISAGGQLSASMVLQQYLPNHPSPLKDLPKLKGQVLIIPALVHPDHYSNMRAKLKSPELSSYVSQVDAPVLPVSRVRMFLELLQIPADTKENDRRANVGNATAEEVKGLPPSVFGIAGADPLRDEGLFYAELLSGQGVPTDVTVFKGVPHGFRRFGEGLKSASEEWDRVTAEGIRWCLSGPVAGEFNIKTD